MLVWSLVLILIGGIVEMVPTFLIKSNVPTIASVEPYTPLELEGRDIYIREGCNACHTQMVRPFRAETERYQGEYAKAGEFVYDHPFLWGSKRTGPDLLRVGGKYPNSWHYVHMVTPNELSTGSIMPPYPWLYEQDLNTSNTLAKINAMRTMGVPYPEMSDADIQNQMAFQTEGIVNDLKTAGLEANGDKEIIALIAYLQRLGTDISKVNPEVNE